MVKRISREASDFEFWVRFLVGALEKGTGDMLSCRQRGYGSMVEHLVANQMMGVRFSLPAPREADKMGVISRFVTPNEVQVCLHTRTEKADKCDFKTTFAVVQKVVDTGDKGQGTFYQVHEIVR